MDGPPDNELCSICHADFQVPCQANCSHWFCGRCILQLWDHGAALHPCKCPLCRREITLLVPIESLSRQNHMAGAADILQRIETYNGQHGESSNGLMQRIQDLPFLLKRLLRDMMDPRRSLPLVVRARVCLATLVSAIYILSPVDIIPEALLGIFGFLDDLIIVLICFLHVAAVYRAVLLARHRGA